MNKIKKKTVTELLKMTAKNAFIQNGKMTVAQLYTYFHTLTECTTQN